MNLFQLVFKQMRQRSLSTWLTFLSVLLGVSLAIAIMILRREGQNLFAQTDFGYDIILGPPKGSPLQLTLNTVYHLDQSPGVLSYQVFDDVSRKSPPAAGRADFRPYVRNAVPFMVGDSFQGRRIVGTSPLMFGVDDLGNAVTGEKFQYRKDESYEFAQGRAFAPRKFEAVIGSDIAAKFGLHLYDEKLSEEENLKNGGAFRATHGMPTANEKPDIHKPRWRVVGILKPTHTANDRVLFVPFISLYAIAEHEEGMIDQALLRANIDPSRVSPQQLDETLAKLGINPSNIPPTVRRKFNLQHPTTTPARAATDDLMHSVAAAPAPAANAEDPDAYHLDEHGDIVPDLPQEEWTLSAILVRSRGDFQSQQMMYNFKVIDDRATAVNPARVMHDFFNTFLAGSAQVLLLISALVTIVAAISIMTTIYNSVAARRREIAILRALGATRGKILALICAEASLIGLLGGIGGFVVGHLLSAVGSRYLQESLGEGINWIHFGAEEIAYLFAVVVLAFLAGLVPALKAYRTSVAANLSAA